MDCLYITLCRRLSVHRNHHGCGKTRKWTQ